MKIKIVEPYDLNPRYDQRSLTPNPGPILVASLLERAGHEVELLSEYVTDFDIEQVHDADLVGISIATYNARRGFEIAKKLNQPVVFGGFHASLLPEECLEFGDYVIRGDGYSIVGLVDFLTDRNEMEIHRIPNLVYKKGSQIVYNKSESRPINIVPNYDLIRDYFKFGFRRLVRIPILVNASRGCHFDCTFCAIKEVYPSFVKKDTPIIIQDIKTQISHRHILSRFLPKIIWITDDNFFSDRKWTKDILRAIANLKSGYCFTVQARVDLASDDEMLRLMSTANFNRVYLGIESLDQKSLKNFNKNSSVEDIRIAVTKFRNNGIDVHGLFVFGDDEFQKGDGRRVAEFARHCGLSGMLLQPLTPYPGTTLFKKLEQEGRILHKQWQDYNGKVVFKPKNMTAAELQKEIYDCYSRVFSLWGVIRFFFTGNMGWKLEFVGEAVFRFLEKIKMKKYIKENLIQYRSI